MEEKMPESQRDHSLPMVVYLRGDEDYVEEFSWDAQATMDYLGIKRSRLTQISGRELRVGRIRQDRYIRPVFRPQDVADYRAWTRTTASHQSSSKAIEQAVERLEAQCDKLEESASAAYEQTISDAIASWRRQADRLEEVLSQALARTRQRLDRQYRYQEGMLNQLGTTLATYEQQREQRAQRLEGRLGRMDEVQTTLHRQLAELAQAIKRDRQQFEAKISELADWLVAQQDGWQQSWQAIQVGQQGMAQEVYRQLGEITARLEYIEQVAQETDVEPSAPCGPSRPPRAVPRGQRRFWQTFSGRRGGP